MNRFFYIIILCVLSLAACKSNSPQLSSQSEVHPDIIKMISTFFQVPKKDVLPSTTIASLGGDDLDFVEMIIMAEKKFQVTIADDAFDKFTGGNRKLETQHVTLANFSEVVLSSPKK